MAQESGEQAIPSELSWVASEHPYYEKGPMWYGALALIAAGLIVAAFATGNAVTAVMIAAAAAAIGVFAARRPEEVPVVIEGVSVRVGEHAVYDIGELKSFWIYYEPPMEPELMLHSRRTLFPLVRIPLADQDPLVVRRYLRRMLPEERETLPLADAIARWVRF